MLLVVGLGNPGARFARHRHNIGYVAADALALRHGLSAPRRRFRSRLRAGEIDGERVLLLKPETFMNESGRAVRQALDFYRLRARDAVVLHDELDLAPGFARVPVTVLPKSSNAAWLLPARLIVPPFKASALRATLIPSSSLGS